MSIIEVKNLTKQFRTYDRKAGLIGSIKYLFTFNFKLIDAVRDLSFSVNEGEIVGFIGPNGAGKSTTVKLMIGILSPTSGVVRINNHDPQHKRKDNLKSIGVVFGQRTQLWWDIPVIETFELLRYMYKIPKDEYQSNLKLLTRVFEVEDFIKKPVRVLSLGQRMRADFIAAMLHRPKILFLDEPTIGLDLIVKRKIRDYILEINKHFNTTIIITTHDLVDIEKLCKRIIIIDKGTKVYDGDLAYLKQIYNDFFEMVVYAESDFINQDCMNQSGVEILEQTGSKLVLKIPNNLKPINIINLLSQDNTLIDFKITEPEIEDIISIIYKKGVRK